MYYDILLGTNFVSSILNREVPANGRVLKYYINSPSIGTASSVHYLEVSPIGRCPLREVPLYFISGDIHIRSRSKPPTVRGLAQYSFNLLMIHFHAMWIWSLVLRGYTQE